MFLAEECGVEAWAADLWIPPTENWRRIQAAGLGGRVFPLHAEAHTLPFADGFFDAIVSFDAYHYFGTNALYTADVARFVRPGGAIGIGEITSIPTAPAVAGAYYQFNGDFQTSLPLKNTPYEKKKPAKKAAPAKAAPAK